MAINWDSTEIIFIEFNVADNELDLFGIIERDLPMHDQNRQLEHMYIIPDQRVM